MLRKPKDTHIHIFMKKCRCILLQSWHRVDRALSFFSSRPNWDYPAPSHAGNVYPSFGSGGGGGGGGFTLTRGRGGEDVGESQFRRGDRHFGTLGSRYLCTYIVNHGEGKSFQNLYDRARFYISYKLLVQISAIPTGSLHT
jgi:hypothetical protein